VLSSIDGDRSISAIRAAHSSRRSRGASDSIDVFRGFREAAQWHVVVDAFVLTGAHEEGFVPDADVSVRADLFVELHPIWVMRLVAIA
jgi:hypothetical protein